jgi:glycosyltransferase involved in cell wall biosynthesis
MRPVYPDLDIVKPRKFSLAYLGIMGPQDGVDVILDVMDELVHHRGRRDVHANLLGFGDCLEDLKRRTTELSLDDVVTFTGRADKAMVARYLSAADVGLCPDLKTPLNDVSTMNKTMEYMAHALPSVSFDLAETRVSGGSSVLYAPSGDVQAFADAVERLLDDPELRLQMALSARERVSTELDWRQQATAYVSVYDELCQVPSEAEELSGQTVEHVDLDDQAELERFILERSPRPVEPAGIPRQFARAGRPVTRIG